jgi:hypothetical protein
MQSHLVRLWIDGAKVGENSLPPRRGTHGNSQNIEYRWLRSNYIFTKMCAYIYIIAQIYAIRIISYYIILSYYIYNSVFF